MSTRAEIRWPDRADVAGWAALANRALQFESAAIDEAESARWAGTVRQLVERQLPYTEYVAERTAALDARLSRRKLDQANLRYKYGFRPGSRPRPAELVRLEIKRYLAAYEPA